MRLASYYHLACDYGTSVMLSWENGGIAPINLCESHAKLVSFSGDNCGDVVGMMPAGARSNHATKHPESSVPTGRPPDTSVGSETEHSAAARAPATGLVSGDSVKVLADEAIGNTPREDFEAYGTVLKPAHSVAATEETLENSDEVHVCSHHAERCTYDATVHCPKCGSWFCDAHAEDGQWHACALTRLEN